jgi:hypothetical protein
VIVQLDELFAPYAAAAVERLRYLFPSCTFRITPTSVEVVGADAELASMIQKETSFQLYREKIYQEGRPLRETMYQALFK